MLSGYPGSLRGPRCDNLRGDEDVPCWQKRSGRIRIGPRTVTLYERGLGHEANHLIAAWTEHGSLYAASIHVDPRIGRARAKRDLLLMLHSLERIVPTAAGPSDDEHDD
ncbi:MAG: hypothetical protein H0T20_01295 [Actinobacteria bacterium]|nr:hypothetical protein [Actinomycetota bacterium]